MQLRGFCVLPRKVDSCTKSVTYVKRLKMFHSCYANANFDVNRPILIFTIILMEVIFDVDSKSTMCFGGHLWFSIKM